MEDEQEMIAALFEASISAFPDELQEKAREWLSQREAAHRLILEIQEKGLEALL